MDIQLKNCLRYFNGVLLNELQEVSICWIAGGCVRDYFSGAKMNSDIDVFFPDMDQLNKCKEYLLSASERRTKETIDDKEVIKIIPKEKAQVIFENDNTTKVRYKGRQIDLIKKTFATPELTIQEFDFTVCCAAIDGKQVYTHNTFWMDLAKRQLMINKLPFPMSTLWRLQKYIKKGYTICSGEMAKLGKAIGELQMQTKEGESKAIEDDSFYDDGPRFTTFD